MSLATKTVIAICVGILCYAATGARVSRWFAKNPLAPPSVAAAADATTQAVPDEPLSVATELPEKEFDFGNLKPSDATNLHHAFEVRNISGEYLHAVSVKSSCGCTAGTITPAEIAPRTSASIDVRVNWSTQPGPERTHVSVYFAEPVQPATVYVKGNVDGPLAMPNFMNIGPLDPVHNSYARTIKLRLGNKADGTARLLTRIQALNPAITVRRLDASGAQLAESMTPGADGAFIVNVHAEHDLPDDQLQLFFYTDDPAVPPATFKIFRRQIP